jgi:hypothetical protein
VGGSLGSVSMSMDPITGSKERCFLRKNICTYMETVPFQGFRIPVLRLFTTIWKLLLIFFVNPRDNLPLVPVLVLHTVQ